jgi:hypothetical protein
MKRAKAIVIALLVEILVSIFVEEGWGILGYSYAVQEQSQFTHIKITSPPTNEIFRTGSSLTIYGIVSHRTAYRNCKVYVIVNIGRLHYHDMATNWNGLYYSYWNFTIPQIIRGTNMITATSSCGNTNKLSSSDVININGNTGHRASTHDMVGHAGKQSAGAGNNIKENGVTPAGILPADLIFQYVH